MSLPVRTTNQEHPLRSPASSTETFTNNNSLIHLAIDSRGSASRPSPPAPADAWTADLSGSLAIIAEQLQNASRTIAAAHASAPLLAADHHLAVRLDALERAQEQLAVELAGLRSLHAGKSREELPSAGSLAGLESRLAEVQAAQKLDQDRLYARLHNSRANVSKMPIMALRTASGKPPPDHPKTKGEFEHVTKERYDGLLKAYNLPVEGDTAAKREALRIFMGLPE